MTHRANPRPCAGRRRGCAAFTVVEVMLVLTLLAIIAGLAWPSLSALQVKARRSEGRSALLQAMQQEERYFSANGRYAEFSRDNPNGFSWHSAGTPASSSHELQAVACDDARLEECIRILARPGTSAVRSSAQDRQCGVLSLDSRGEKTADGALALCWP